MSEQYCPAYLSTVFTGAAFPENFPKEFAIISACSATGETWPTPRNPIADTCLRHDLLQWPVHRLVGQSLNGSYSEPEAGLLHALRSSPLALGRSISKTLFSDKRRPIECARLCKESITILPRIIPISDESVCSSSCSCLGRYCLRERRRSTRRQYQLPRVTPASFIAKSSKVELTERSACHQHFLDLCDLVDHPKPAEVDSDRSKILFRTGTEPTGGGCDRTVGQMFGKRGFSLSNTRVATKTWRRPISN